MHGEHAARRRWRLTGLVVGAATLLIAAPLRAQDDSTPVPARDAEGRATTSPVAQAPVLNVGYFDRAGLPADVMSSMRAEVERLIGSLDITIVSIDGSALTSSRNLPQGRLVNVVVWKELPAAWDVPRHTMGLCPNSGELPRSVYVFESNVLGELGLRSRGIEAMRGEDVGRAFGRVAAHELIHAFATFAGEPRHRGTGLMGGQLDRNTLLLPGLEVDDRSGRAFVKGITKAGFCCLLR